MKQPFQYDHPFVNIQVSLQQNILYKQERLVLIVCKFQQNLDPLPTAVKEALGKFSAVPSIDFDTEGLIEFPTEIGSENDNLTIPTTNIDPTYNPFNERRSKPSGTHRVVEKSAFTSDDYFL